MKLKLGNLIFAFVLMATSIFAQRPNQFRDNLRPDLERVKATKIAWLTQKMSLSPTEAEKFWPIHNEYEKEQKKIREKYQPNKDLLTLDDANLEKHLYGLLEMEEEMIALKKKYYKKFSEIIGFRKVAVLAKSDREFNFHLIQKINNQKKNER